MKTGRKRSTSPGTTHAAGGTARSSKPRATSRTTASPAAGKARAGHDVSRESPRAERKPGGPGAIPPAPHGVRATGRIAKLYVGQAYGFIRETNGREVYFHRSDLGDGASFNDFAVGDQVSFELVDDAVSGARGLKVKKQRRR